MSVGVKLIWNLEKDELNNDDKENIRSQFSEYHEEGWMFHVVRWNVMFV